MKHIVSVVVPVFNSELYLNEAIDSIVKQIYSEIEIILVDDGSTDSSGSICDEWSRKDSRIISIHTRNMGPSSARNTGISIAKGDYILPVDSDDIIDETYVQKAAQVLDQNSNIGIVYCKAGLFGDKSGEWVISDYSIKNILIKNCIFSTAMFRKCDWEKTGGYSNEMKMGLEDYDLWLSIISLKRKVFKIPEILFYYRKHVNSRSYFFENDLEQVRTMEIIRFRRHRKLYEDVYYIPESNKKIALYGAGLAGKTYISFLKSLEKKIISCCVDVNYQNIKSEEFGCEINPPEYLISTKHDEIIVAVNDDEAYNCIQHWLMENEYLDKQIVRYLNIEATKMYE